MEASARRQVADANNVAREKEEAVEIDAAKVRKAAHALSREAKRRRQAIQDSISVMCSTVGREAMAMRRGAAIRMEEMLREVEAIKEQANILCNKRIEEAAAALKPVAVVAPLPPPPAQQKPIIDIETSDAEAEEFL